LVRWATSMAFIMDHVLIVKLQERLQQRKVEVHCSRLKPLLQEL
jgi:hypothetical protein